MSVLASGRRRDRGATVVEFAIVLPLLLLILLALVEFGRLGFSFTEVWTAAREGARHATTVGNSDGDALPNFVDCDDIVAHALGKVTMLPIAAGDVTVRYLDPDGNPIAHCDGVTDPLPQDAGNIDPGTQIEVTVIQVYTAIVPIVGGFVDGVPLDSTQRRSVHYGVGE